MMMNRMTNWCAGLLFLAIAPPVIGQEPQLTRQFPEDALATQQLIAWSRLQKPQPAPQPLPPRETPVPEPDQQGQQAKSPSDPQTQPTETQSFTGKIVKDGGKYVLQVASNGTYQLDQQGGVKQYEGQDVRVIGNLDKDGHTIRVVKIELLS
jgi:hypothetical protein